MGNKVSNDASLPEISNVERQRLVSMSWQLENWNPLYESPCSDTESFIGERHYSVSQRGLSVTLESMSNALDSRRKHTLEPPVRSNAHAGETTHRFSFQLSENPKHIKVRLPTWKQEEFDRQLEQQQQHRERNLIYIENILQSPSMSAKSSNTDFSSDVLILWELLDRSFDRATSINAKLDNGFEVRHERLKTMIDRPIVDEPMDSRGITILDQPISPQMNRKRTVDDFPLSPQSENEFSFQHKEFPRSYARMERLLEANVTPRCRGPSSGVVDFSLFSYSDGEILVTESISPHSGESDAAAENIHPEGRTSMTERSFVFVEQMLDHNVQSWRRCPEESRSIEKQASLVLPVNEKRENLSMDSVLSQDLYAAGSPEEISSPTKCIVEENGYYHFPRMQDSSFSLDFGGAEITPAKGEEKHEEILEAIFTQTEKEDFQSNKSFLGLLE